MPSFWSLLVAGAAISGMCLWWTKGSAVGKVNLVAAFRATPRFQSRSGAVDNPLPIRTLQSISFEELRLLTECNHECILVNVRSDPLLEPTDIAGIFVLSIGPSELREVLRWLPADRAVAFHGVSDSSFALIESSECMNSPEPRCILEDLPGNLETK